MRNKKVKLDKIQKELCQMDEEGRAYLQYNEIVGGEPLGLTVPYGYPEGVEELGGVIAVYRECIRKQLRWEELLKVTKKEEDTLI